MSAKLLLLVVFVTAFTVGGISGATVDENTLAPEQTSTSQDIQTALVLYENEKQIDGFVLEDNIEDIESSESDLEADGSNSAGKWEDGKVVKMTPEEVAELKKRIYSCKTEEEYI